MKMVGFGLELPCISSSNHPPTPGAPRQRRILSVIREGGIRFPPDPFHREKKQPNQTKKNLQENSLQPLQSMHFHTPGAVLSGSVSPPHLQSSSNSPGTPGNEFPALESWNSATSKGFPLFGHLSLGAGWARATAALQKESSCMGKGALKWD